MLLDISGNDINDEHSLNIQFISSTLIVFHLDISGNDTNDENPENIKLISIRLTSLVLF
jgi:hypothetical protein